MKKFPILLAAFLFLSSCNPSTMKLTSPVFEDNGNIPALYTCDSENISPPLNFENIPEGTQSLALIVDDPDAPVGTWVHWVVWNIDSDTGAIAENTVPTGAQQGTNDFGVQSWGGPCPPKGLHRYFFKLYALDTRLDLPEASIKTDLEAVMDGHILEKAELVGTYERH